MSSPTSHALQPPPPTVLVGIPTYNRGSSLERAVASVLRQQRDDFNVRILVVDNGSDGESADVARRLALAHDEVTVLLRTTNAGLIANYNSLFGHASAYLLGDNDYFVFLADDDTISDNFLRETVATLNGDPTCVLAAGRTQLIIDGEARRYDPDVQLLSDAPHERICAFARDVTPTGVFTGVMRGSTARALPNQPNSIGHDWIFLYNIAALGTIRTVHAATVFRAIDGISAGTDQLQSGLNVSRWQARSPLVTIWLFLARDILWRSPVFRATMSLAQRCRLVGGLAAAFAERRLAR